MQISELTEKIRGLSFESDVYIMEVCGTHTMEIAKAGIKSLLPKNVHLLSGPGCPVCVTAQNEIDYFLKLSENPDNIIATYGDMLRVPGSKRGDSLMARRAAGANVEIVYSPIDALEIAEKKPQKQIIFLGVGFETTAPGTALSMKIAKEKGIANYSVLPMLKTVEPALRKLIADPEFRVKGFLCPGHVAAITGASAFEFLPREFGIPAVVAGFEPEKILLAVYHLLLMISEGRAELVNDYPEVVSYDGNELAQIVIKSLLKSADKNWRGLGVIKGSGLVFRDDPCADAFIGSTEIPGCRCGDIICGKAEPVDCPLFGDICSPDEPVGPCMVSSEGACAAVWKYGVI